MAIGFAPAITGAHAVGTKYVNPAESTTLGTAAESAYYEAPGT